VTRPGALRAIDSANLDGAAVIATISQSQIGPPNSLNPNRAVLGGGIYNDGTLGPASLSLRSGTVVAHNRATVDGGGVDSAGPNASLSIAPGVVIPFNSPNNVSG
jgi:hypothetical protein